MKNSLGTVKSEAVNEFYSLRVTLDSKGGWKKGKSSLRGKGNQTSTAIDKRLLKMADM